MHISEIFKALGDKTRLRILNLLSKRELCVCQIHEIISMSQPNASKHLNRLRYAGIIVCRKVSQWCFYSINEKFIKNSPILYEYLVEQWAVNKQFIDDKKRLDELLEKYDCCAKLLNKQGSHISK